MGRPVWRGAKKTYSSELTRPLASRIRAVKIQLNGETRECSAKSLDDLIRELKLDGKPIAVEKNRDVVPKSKYRELNQEFPDH